MKNKREELLKIPVVRLSIVDNLGDPKCNTCSGHGCLDRESMWGCIMEHCPDCYNKKEIQK